MQQHLTALVLVSLPGLPVAAASGVGEDPPDFAHDIGLPAAELVRMDPAPKELMKTVSKRIGEKASFLEELRLYRGKTEFRGARVTARFAELRLRDHDGVRVVLCVDDGGNVIGAGLWGGDEVDTDPSVRWGAFMSQLQRSAVGNALSLATDEKAARPGAEKRALKKLPKKERSQANALLEHRRLMRANSQALVQVFSLQSANRAPKAAWIDALRAGYLRTAELTDDLEGLLAEVDLEVHRRVAEETLPVFDEMEARLAEGEEAFIAAGFAMRLRQSCGACHGHASAEGPTLQEALAGRLAGFGLPEGMLRVGYDLAPLAGASEEDAELAQDVATGLRGVLLLLDGLARG